MKPKDTLSHPNPPQNGGGDRTVGSDFHDCPVADKSASVGAGQFDALGPFTRSQGDFRVTIKASEAFVHEGVIRHDQFIYGTVIKDEVFKESLSFFDHRILNNEVECFETTPVWRGEIDQVEGQPLIGKTLDKTFRFGVIEKTIKLAVEFFRVRS